MLDSRLDLFLVCLLDYPHFIKVFSFIRFYRTIKVSLQGEPVYVNYGRKKDFEMLKTDLGIDLEDKIGIARYGKIFRGDKVSIRL